MTVAANGERISVFRRLVLLTTFFLLNLAVVGAAFEWTQHQLGNSLEQLGETQLPLVRNATLVDMYHDAIMGVTYRSLVSLGTTPSETERQAIAADSEELYKDMLENLTAVEKLIQDPETQALAKPIRAHVESYIDSSRGAISASLRGDRHQATEGLAKTRESFEVLEKDLEVFGGKIQSVGQNSAQTGISLAEKSRKASLFVVVISLFLGGCFTWITLRTLKIQIQDLIRQLYSSSEKLSLSAERVDSAAHLVTEATVEEAASIQQTASSVEEISAMVKKTAHGAVEMAKNAQSSEETSIQGGDTMRKMNTAVEGISHANQAIIRQVEDGNNKIKEIVSLIEKIATKTEVINDIVFQTKLLSFNASVEAARAGENGKGFAVVAEEVGKLAQMSGTAAQEISEILSSSRARVESIVAESSQRVRASAAEGQSRIEAGLETTHECQTIFTALTEGSRSVRSLSEEVSKAISEQSRGVEEVVRAMNQLDETIHQNSATAKSLSGEAQNMRSESKSLSDSIIFAEITLLGSRKEKSSPKDSAVVSHVDRSPSAV